MKSITSTLAIVAAAGFFVTGAQGQTPLGLDTGTYILENLNGGAVAASAPNLNASGLPVTTVYSSEGASFTAASGTGGNAGNVLVNGTGTLVPCGTGCGSAAPAGDSWVSASNTDPTNSYKWVQATYASEAGPAGAIAQTIPPAPSVISTNTWVSGDYAVDSTGKFVTNLANCVTATPCTWVSPTAADSKNIAVGDTATGSITYPSLGSGRVWSNAAGQYTAAGPGGVTVADKSGNQTSVTSTGVTATGTIQGGTLTDGAGTTITGGNVTSNSVNTGTITATGTVTAPQFVATGLNGASTVLSGAGLSYVDGHGGSVTIGDPSITVSNGTAAGTTSINNGAVSAGSSLTVGSVAGNQTKINNGSIVANNVAAGTVYGGVLSTQDSSGTQYSNVGDTLTRDQAAINSLTTGLNKAYEGTAIALAISQPVFLPGQTFAMRFGWGDFQSQNALGLSAAGVIAHDVFGHGSTLTLDGGLGIGTNYNTVAGKAGVTLGFGGGYAPLK